MNEPVGQAELPTYYLKIQGDPTPWGLDTAPPPDGWNDGPVAIRIIFPVVGSLILSPAHAGSFLLTGEIDSVPENGWMNGQPVELVRAYLYIPTAVGLTAHSHGYPLDPQYSLPDLQRKILDAMTTGSLLTVPIDALGGGHVILNGAQLPFAVLAEVQTN
jgi:hypothetical protein